MFDISAGRLFEVAVVLAVMLLVAFPVHEFAHALAATRLGDSTPRLMGRLTLDPRAHFDPAGAIILAVDARGASRAQTSRLERREPRTIPVG